MVELFANSGGHDQMPRYVASDLGLHCLLVTLLVTLLGVSQLQWVNALHARYNSGIQCIPQSSLMQSEVCLNENPGVASEISNS